MGNFTRQERVLLFSLIAVLGLGAALIVLKRSFGMDLFQIHEHDERIELGNARAHLLVFVKGAVESPGIYRLSLGSRVMEAVQKARPRSDADLDSLALADFVRDGETLVVPEISQPKEGVSSEKTSLPTAVEKINVNTASATELDSLPGVGPEIASRIIAYREEQPFTRVEDLLKVAGIGRKKFEGMKQRVKVQ